MNRRNIIKTLCASLTGLLFPKSIFPSSASASSPEEHLRKCFEAIESHDIKPSTASCPDGNPEDMKEWLSAIKKHIDISKQLNEIVIDQELNSIFPSIDYDAPGISLERIVDNHVKNCISLRETLEKPTTVKPTRYPDHTLLMGQAPGVHPQYFKHYLRRIRINEKA